MKSKVNEPTIKNERLNWLKRRLIWIIPSIIGLFIIMFGAMMWFATGQMLAPSFKGATKDFSYCAQETVKAWGEGCGNIRTTHQFTFSEVEVPSTNGYKMPGWLIKSADNNTSPARGVIMLVHAGGSDRRQDSRYIQFYLNQKLDVLTFDQGCAGEAPCPVPGLSYGQRESRDVFSAYTYLTDKYEKVYAMGSSVGAASVLIALPEMPKLAGVIAENPMASFQRLIKEAPESKGMPEWMGNVMISLAMQRGKFDGESSAAHSLPLAKNVPVLFIHSKQDKIVNFSQTEDLAKLYAGPKTVWLTEKGDHAEIWDTNKADYEAKVADFLK